MLTVNQLLVEVEVASKHLSNEDILNVYSSYS